MTNEFLLALEKDIAEKHLAVPLEREVDHERLAQSLEGIPYPEHYIEVALKGRGLLSGFRSPLFSTVRVIIMTENYTLARVYPGNQKLTSEQADFLEKLYFDDSFFLDYIEVPDPEGVSHELVHHRPVWPQFCPYWRHGHAPI